MRSSVIDANALFPRTGGLVGRHHIAVSRLRPGQATYEHTYDFSEVFMVEQGRGVHQWNGRDLPLERGSLSFIQSGDVHSFQSAAHTPLMFINLAFSDVWWADFLRLFSPDIEFARAFAGDPPGHVWLAAVEARRCGERLHDVLERGGREPALLPEAVAVIMQRLQHPAGPLSAAPAGAPDWVVQWLRDLQDPELVAQPIGFWQKRAGVSPEHLARTCRQFLDESPTVLLNRARINLVKMRLRQGEERMATLALDAGFQNLGFFYRCFRRFESCAPKTWLFRHAASGPVPR